MSATVTPPPAPPPAAPSHPPPTRRPGGRTFGRAALPVALWIVFAALVAGGGVLMLRACGAGGALGFVRNYCPAPFDQGFAREIAAGEALRRQVHAAEMALADVPPCPAPAPRRIDATPPASPPRPPVTAPASPGMPPLEHAFTPDATPAEREESRGIDRRVEQRGGKRGRLQITLAWNTLDDLDLNVSCPGGRISSFDGEQGPDICGDGVKDLDANRNLAVNVSETPVENIRWSADVPEGSYTIEVIEYRAASSGGNRVPFTLRMRLDDSERECHETVVQFAPREMVRRNGVTVTGTAQTLRWRSGEPLPDCDFTATNTVHIGASK